MQVVEGEEGVSGGRLSSVSDGGCFAIVGFRVEGKLGGRFYRFGDSNLIGPINSHPYSRDPPKFLGIT